MKVKSYVPPGKTIVIHRCYNHTETTNLTTLILVYTYALFLYCTYWHHYTLDVNNIKSRLTVVVQQLYGVV